jgi:hypothetical protein
MASDAALFIGWKLPVAGREADAIELYGSFVGFLSKQEAAGTVDSFEPCLLAPHGGDLDGFILVRGERNKLSALRHSDEFEDLVARCLISVDGFGVVDAYVGDSVGRQLQRYAKNIRR